MNFRIDNVRRAFECVQTAAAGQLVDRTGHAFPSGGHFQGVQRIPGTPDRIVLTSSSDSEAYMVCSGLHIVSTSRFEVYAAKGTSGDHATGTTITLNHFRAV
jgi:hypothetical protein